MAAMLRDSVIVAAVVVVVRTRPRAIPLAMITMRKFIDGFPFLSHISMGLPSAGAPLINITQKRSTILILVTPQTTKRTSYYQMRLQSVCTKCRVHTVCTQAVLGCRFSTD